MIRFQAPSFRERQCNLVVIPLKNPQDPTLGHPTEKNTQHATGRLDKKSKSRCGAGIGFGAIWSVPVTGIFLQPR